MDDERGAWLAWLAEGTDGDGFCGFDRVGWESSRWILHSIFEDPSSNHEATHDDLRRQRVAAGLEHPFEKLLDDAGAVVVGNTLGMAQPRGVECERLRWGELAQRLGVGWGAQAVPPCDRWFPYSSWPAGIWPPDEGSLDHESVATLVAWLAARSPSGEETACLGYFTPMIGANYERPMMYEFRLGELAALAESIHIAATPSNWWPIDRSWFVYTDYDLWGTKFSGDASMVASLADVADLETIVWP